MTAQDLGNPAWRHAAAALLLMLCSVVLARAITPRETLAAFSRGVQLDTAIPLSFGAWRSDPRSEVQVVNPQQETLLKTLYAQTLTRTYVNALGERVMLSIAYGAEQAGALQLHRPEVCYVAQGFSMATSGQSSIARDGAAAVPLQRLLARLGTRTEPITYWMRVGDDVIASGLQQQLSRIKHGLRGWVADGVLLRVSSLSSEPASAYALQERFLTDLVATVQPQTRRFLIGPVSVTDGAAVAAAPKRKAP